jgi:mannose-1-phosphate guanylyltransferase
VNPARPRALVLAAGLGTRLLPLTAATPKPLLPVRGKPILAHTLLQLAAAGYEAAAVNLHHHGDQIRRAFGDDRGRADSGIDGAAGASIGGISGIGGGASIGGMPLVWSEEPVLLGTLGALGPLLDFLAAADPLLIVNGDSLCRWPFAALLRRHRESGALATLLLASRPDPAAFGGGVAVGRGGAVVSLRPGAGSAGGESRRRQVFAGAHVLSRRILPDVQAALQAAGAPPTDIVRRLYEPLLASRPGCIAAIATAGRWHDLGTPRRFLAAALDWAGADRAAGARTGRRGWVSTAAAVAAGAAVTRSSVDAGCTVAAGAVIEGSVLLPGAQVGAGCQVRGSLLGPGAQLPAGSRLEDQLLVAGASGPIAL